VSSELSWDLFSRDNASRGFNTAAASAGHLSDQIDQVMRHMDELGMNSKVNIKIDANTGRAIAQLEAVKAAEDRVGKSADAAKGNAGGGINGMIAAIAGLGPAAIPVTATVGGALLGLLPIAASAVLGFKGITAEMASGALQGTEFAKNVSYLKSQFTNLEMIAANGMLNGLTMAFTSVRPLFATITQDVRVFSTMLGNVAAAIVPALVHGLSDLQPLFFMMGDAITKGADAFSYWASNTDVIQRFVAYVQTYFPVVESFLANLVTLVFHLISAFSAFGGSSLVIITNLIRLLNMIPVNVLRALVPAVLGAAAAFDVLKLSGTSLKDLNNLMAISGPRAAAMALQQKAASLQIQAAVAQETAAVTRARAEEAAATAESSLAIAASLEGTSSMLAGQSTAAAESAIEFSAAMQAEADAAAASAAEITASADAAAAAATTAGEAASIGWSTLLGPIGAVAAGIGVLSVAFIGNRNAAVATQMEINSLTDAIKQDSGAIGANTKAYLVNTLQKQGAFTDAQKLGISFRTVTAAAEGNRGAIAQVTAAMTRYGYGVYGSTKNTHDQVAAAQDLNKIINSQSGDVKKAVTAYEQQTAAMGQSTSSMHSNEAAIKSLTAATKAYVDYLMTQQSGIVGVKLALATLNQTVKQNGTNLSEATAKGLTNRQALLGILSSIEQNAKASHNYNGVLQQQIGWFVQGAEKAGYQKKAIDQLLASVGLGPAKMKALNDSIQALRNKTVKVTVDASQVAPALNAAAASIASAGAAAGQNYSAAFRAALRIRSPSKVFYQYGIWIVEGLINGVKYMQPKANSVAADLAAGFAKGFSTGAQSNFLGSLTSTPQHLLNRMAAVAANAIAREQNRLAAARTALANLLSQRRSAISSLSSTMQGGAALSGLFQTSAAGTPVVANINQFLGGQAASLKRFAHDLSWARRHGMSYALLSQIASLGPDQGEQVLQEFMHGGASIGRANAAESAIQQYAKAGATTAEDKYYGPLEKKAKDAVADNTKWLKELTNALHRIERSTAREAALHVTIDAKTGKPVVDKKFIDEIVQGIRKAERLAGKRLV
jgi:hypothetical protein